MARKPKIPEAEEKENEERWLLSYADMITLLVAFFIMMYSMSVVNLEKYKQFAISIKSGFGMPFHGNEGQFVVNRSGSLVKEGKPTVPRTQQGSSGRPSSRQSFIKEDIRIAPDAGFFEKINRQLAAVKLDGYVLPMLDNTSASSNSYVVTIADNIYFKPGEAMLSDQAREKLVAIATALKSLDNYVVVEGYSSSVSPDLKNASNSVSEANSWVLSSQRAANVINFLCTEKGLNPRRFILSAYGEWSTFKPPKKLALTGNGQWIEISDEEHPEQKKDRVIVSVKFGEFQDPGASDKLGPHRESP